MILKYTCRLIKSTFNRFIAILAIVFIGVSFMMGLRSNYSIMRNSVEKYNDDTNLYDIQIYSNYGFDDNDKKEIESLDYVEDVYASDLFKEWCERTYAWNQAGFISKDALSDDTGASARVKSGAYMSMMSCGKPGYITQITGECGMPVTVFNCGESFMAAGSVSSFPWCINQNTEDPVLAMQILEAM